jgi:hypothetical protein
MGWTLVARDHIVQTTVGRFEASGRIGTRACLSNSWTFADNARRPGAAVANQQALSAQCRTPSPRMT